MPQTRPLLVRLINNISYEGDCWIYTGTIARNGYGRIAERKENGTYKMLSAHRVSYERFVGKIPKGLVIDHTCHTSQCKKGSDCRHRRCVNPKHLEQVTQKENLSRGYNPKREMTHCKRNHEFTPENTYIIPTGGRRQCKACVRLNYPLHPRTHCKKGHKFDVKYKRQQVCRICHNERNKAYKLRKKFLLLT